MNKCKILLSKVIAKTEGSYLDMGTGSKNALDSSMDNIYKLFSDLTDKVTIIAAIVGSLALVVAIAVSKLSNDQRQVAEAEQWTKRIIVGIIGIALAPQIIKYIIGYMAVSK